MTPAPTFEEAVSVSTLTYAYPGHTPIITGATLHLPPGSRCLMVGANGAGKTTLLQILAGKHMVGEGKVHILGRSTFHDIDLISSGELSYLGPQWKRDMGCVGSDVPLQGDLSAGQLIFGVEGADPERRDRLIELLDVDLGWRLNRVSDGQRRRVQICLGLLRPYRVLLLDEVTVDMDVVGRLDLLAFFKQECSERGATIIYATHIFDGLEGWVTHLAYIAGGALVEGGPVGAKADLRPGRKLLPTVQDWLRAERDARRGEEAADPWARERRPGAAAPAAQLEVPRKHMMYFRG